MAGYAGYFRETTYGVRGVTARLIGITGGIGSGKSSVSRLLASYCNAPLEDLDLICKGLLQPGQPGWLGLRDIFGAAFFLDNGELDRQALRSAIFSDDAIRCQVDKLVHPLARGAMKDAIASYPVPLVFVEIPLLYEAGWQDDVDEVVAVIADQAVCCQRIIRRDCVTETEALRAISSQMNLEEKASQADYVIDNSGTWRETRMRVVELGKRLS